MKLEINFTNEYGEEFSTVRKVDEDWAGMDEKEFLLDTYKNFLNNLGYALDKGDEVIINHTIAIKDDNYCGSIFLTKENLINNSKEIANLVAEEFNKARSNTGLNKPVIVEY